MDDQGTNRDGGGGLAGNRTPELETLDQLQGGDMNVGIIRSLYQREEHFCRAIIAMLRSGEIRLYAPTGDEAPAWESAAIIGDATRWEGYTLSITALGAKRA
jgi:hypothetical protein